MGTGALAHDGIIKVSYPHVNEVQDVLWAANGAIGTLLLNLDEALGPLKASWAGNDRDEYDVRKGQWDLALLQMNQTLRNSSGTLDLLVDNYKRADLTLAFSWSQLK